MPRLSPADRGTSAIAGKAGPVRLEAAIARVPAGTAPRGCFCCWRRRAIWRARTVGRPMLRPVTPRPVSIPRIVTHDLRRPATRPDNLASQTSRAIAAKGRLTALALPSPPAHDKCKQNHIHGSSRHPGCNTGRPSAVCQQPRDYNPTPYLAPVRRNRPSRTAPRRGRIRRSVYEGRIRSWVYDSFAPSIRHSCPHVRVSHLVRAGGPMWGVIQRLRAPLTRVYHCSHKELRAGEPRSLAFHCPLRN